LYDFLQLFYLLLLLQLYTLKLIKGSVIYCMWHNAIQLYTNTNLNTKIIFICVISHFVFFLAMKVLFIWDFYNCINTTNDFKIAFSLLCFIYLCFFCVCVFIFKLKVNFYKYLCLIYIILFYYNIENYLLEIWLVCLNQSINKWPSESTNFKWLFF
jgi:hypothetical protein